MEIIKNPLMHREEVTLELEKEIPHSNEEAAKIISEQTKKPIENIVIEKIITHFGSRKVVIRAKVYESEETRKRIETVPRKVRRKQEKEAAEAAGKK